MRACYPMTLNPNPHPNPHPAPEPECNTEPKPKPGAYVCAGLSGYGVMAANAAGELLAQHVAAEPLPAYAHAFRPERWLDADYRRRVESDVGRQERRERRGDVGRRVGEVVPDGCGGLREVRGVAVLGM